VSVRSQIRGPNAELKCRNSDGKRAAQPPPEA
jgi:hypothetical protein